MRIAICDNDQQSLDELCSLIDTYIAEHPSTDDFYTSFLGPATLLSATEQDEHAFDIFILDVLMPGMTGLELGSAIRANQPNASIIYTTSSKEFALDAFNVHALDYLVKPVDAKALSTSLDMARDRVDTGAGRKMQIRGRNGVTSVETGNIEFVENLARVPMYNMSDGTVIAGSTNRGTFEAAVGPLASDPAFVQPHKSFFVNMHFVRTLGQGVFILDDGRQIPISRKNASYTRKRYLSFLSREGSL